MFDALGPLEGLRIWRHEGGRLLSLNGTEWAIPPRAAECVGRPKSASHEAPAIGCSCGYYAAADLPALLPQFIDARWRVFRGLSEGSYVAGPVKGWGRAIPHRSGWRAQYAKPLGLYELTVPPVPPEYRQLVISGRRGFAPITINIHPVPSRLIDLADRYGVPLLPPSPILRNMMWRWSRDSASAC